MSETWSAPSSARPGLLLASVTQVDTDHTGYTSYFGLDRDPHRMAVVALSDLAAEATTDLGIDVLARNG
jgi:hypothetical protein